MTGARRLCMGVDIEEGSPRGSRARYSVVVIDGDGMLVHKSQGATLARLVRLAWEYRPECIATDNVYELAENARDLARLLSLLPPTTRLVQVTVGPEGRFQPMERVAARLRELGRLRLTPARTAYLAALAASLGEGAEVRFSEEKTVIVVSRGRNPKGGGMSHDRYMRRIRASVRQAALRIQKALDDAGIDFDVSIRRGEGGYDSAVFTVYAPRSRLEGIVRPHRGVDYVVTVKTVYGGRLVLRGGGEKPQRPVIVGIDPGQTTGLAILDLDGRVLHYESGKGLDRGTIISIIERFGRPVIVAVDVARPPEAARKIAAKFNAELYAPPEDLGVGEKAELAAKALGGGLPPSTHERDAIAAAYKAWLGLRAKLDRIESYLDRIEVDLDRESVKEGVLRGLTLAEAVEREIEKIISSHKGGAREARAPGQHQHAGPPPGYAERIQALEAEKYALERALERRDKRIAELEEEVSLLRRRLARQSPAPQASEERLREAEARIESLERLVDELRRRVEELEEEARRAAALLWEASRGEIIVARSVSSLTLSNLREEARIHGPLGPGDVVYVSNPGSFERRAVEELARSRVAAVLLDGVSVGLAKVLERLLVPALPLEPYKRGVYRGLLLVDARVLEDAAARREELEALRAAAINLERLVAEYRAERARELARSRKARGRG